MQQIVKIIAILHANLLLTFLQPSFLQPSLLQPRLRFHDDLIPIMTAKVHLPCVARLVNPHFTFEQSAAWYTCVISNNRVLFPEDTNNRAVACGFLDFCVPLRIAIAPEWPYGRAHATPVEEAAMMIYCID